MPFKARVTSYWAPRQVGDVSFAWKSPAWFRKDNKQIYAQLKKEVLSGKYDYLDKEEEKKVQRHN